MRKRLLALLLAFVMAVGLLPTVAWAADGDVCVIGNTGYTSLNAAVAAATAGDTIWITANDEAEQQITIDKSLTLELQGFALRKTALKITGSTTTVNINDRVGTGSINTGMHTGFRATEHSRCYATLYITDDASVIISGTTGTSTTTGTVISRCAASDLNKAVFLGSGTLTINGGTFAGTKTSGCDALFVYTGTVTINDGYFSANCGLSYNAAPSDANPLVIHKGTFDGGMWIEESGSINGQSISYGTQTVDAVTRLFLSGSTGSVVLAGSTSSLIKIGSGLFLSDTVTSQTLPDGSFVAVGSTDSANPEQITKDTGTKIILQPQILGGDGTSTVTYEWKKDGTTIAESTGDSHTIPSYSVEDDGTYTLTATQGENSITVYYQVGEATTPPAPAHSHPICGVLCSSATRPTEENHGEAVTFQPITIDTDGKLLINGVAATASYDSYELPQGSYYLDGDVTLDKPLGIASSVTVNLCLNGYKLSMKNGVQNSVILLKSSRTLNLCDCYLEGTTHSGQDYYHTYTSPVSNAQKTINGGLITGGNSTSDGGGAIYFSGGILNMYGGTIAGNHSADKGGGVCVAYSGAFNMYGGSIRDNACDGNGGGVYVANGGGTFTLSGRATIGESYGVGNSAAEGGGVYISSSGTFNMNGGSVCNNTATINGGGVYYANGSFNVSGEVIVNSNTVNNTSNNLYLASGRTITVTNPIQYSYIHVTTQTAPTESSPVNITGSQNADYSSAFYSDDSRYVIQDNDLGNGYHQVRMEKAAHTHAWATAWTNNDANHWHECEGTGTCDITADSGKDSYGEHVYDDGQDTTCNTCGYTRTMAPAHSHDGVTFTPWNGTDDVTYTGSTASLYLTKDVTRSDVGFSVPAGKSLHLCLNGFTVSGNIATGLFSVDKGGALTVCDCSESSTGKIHSGNGFGCVGVYNQGAFILKSGTVEGVAVGVYNGGNNYDCTINGGVVTGRSGVYNQGFGAYAKTFIKGGTITGSTEYGVHNYAAGTELYLSGAPSISGAKADIYTEADSSYIYADDSALPATPYSGKVLSLGYPSPLTSGNAVVRHVTEATEDKFKLADENYGLTWIQSTNILIIQAKETAPAITTEALPDGEINSSYNQTLTATGTTPITWSVTQGSLPSGLNLNTSTGSISGRPTTAGTSTFTVTATNGAGSADKELSITVKPSFGITTSSLPNGVVGTAYSAQMECEGAPDPNNIRWSISNSFGANKVLPDGLTISTDGIISGTPTTAGTFTFFPMASSGGKSATMQFTITISETAPALPHTHTWATAWTTNTTHHWHECEGIGICDITANSGKSGYGTHTPGDWIIDQEATTEAAGSKHKACTICGYTTATETIPKLEPGPSHTHAWATAWTTSTTHHWHECEGIGICDITANSGKSGYGTHTPGDWIIDQEATTEAAGSKHKACTVCGYTTATETIPKLEPGPSHTHAWANAWTTSDTHHWHECTADDCTVTENSGKDGYGEHTPGEWIVDQEATADTAGSKHKECTVCGYTTATETIPKLEPGPSHTHAWANAWTTSDTHHWHKCTADGCTITDFSTITESGYGEHTWNDGVVTKEPTATAEGIKTYTCTLCAATKTETVPISAFDISGTVTDSEDTAVEGATVKLVQGNIQVASTTTDASGNYSFSNVAPGSYNVVAEQTKDGSTKTMTILVTITNANLSKQNLKMPSDSVNSVLEVKGDDTPAVVVGGLEKEAEANKAENSTVTVTMTVEGKEENAAANAAEIKAIAGEDKKLEYLEIKVEKKVETDGSTATDILSTTSNLLTIVIPFDFTGKVQSSVAVYRYHGNSVDTLTTTANKSGERISLGTDSITLYVKNFSTYAIGYTESAEVNYTVTFDSQGGSAVASQTVAQNGKVTKPANPTRSGYSFGGWYQDAACTTVWNFDSNTVTSSMTLYAKWTSNGGTPTGGGGGGSYSPTTYPILVQDDITDGTVISSHKNASRGITITITVTPDESCEISGVTVIDKDGKEISVTARGNGKYTFTMPASKVTVSASFAKIKGSYANCPKDYTCPIWPYTDASVTAWYHDGVHYCIENGLMSGYGNYTFGPNGDTNRAMIATILWRLEGSPVVNHILPFDDVAEDIWYTEAIRWATASGVVSGYGNGKFGPADPITREQLAAMLYRYEQYKDGGFTGAWMFPLNYADAELVSSWAYEPMCWTTENGIIQGIGSGLLDPKGRATRAQAAAMIMRFCEKKQ